MRISAEFEQYEDALVAHRALVDDIKVDPENIEVRSPYPLPEDAIPPHRHRRMRMRNWVRFLWVCGAVSGFVLAAGTQLDYPIRTGGHAIVPIPMNAIITYECGMITGLVSTCILFFLETRTFRMRPIPQREDLAVANGDCAIVVDGPLVEKARERLQGARGVRTVRTYTTSIAAVLGLIALLFSQAGCTVRMRNQPAIRDSERPTVSAAAGISSMPWWKDPDIDRLPGPYGRLLTPDQFAILRAKHPVMAAQGGKSTPPDVASFPNPVPDDEKSLAYGKQLFAENCIFCHGPQGKGDGKVAEIYLPKPANLSRQDLVNESDGQLYWTISMAPLGMPPFATKMTAADRFTIIKYVRKLQRDAGQSPNTGGPTNMPPPPAPSPIQSPAASSPLPPESASPTPLPASTAPASGAAAPTSASPAVATVTPAPSPSAAPASPADAAHGSPAATAPVAGSPLPATGSPAAAGATP